MKKQLSRFNLRAVVIGCICAIILLFGMWQVRVRRLRADSAIKSAVTCQLLSDEIKELRKGPIWAALRAAPPAELAQRIEGAAQAAEIPAEHILRIDPQPPRRLGDTVYREHRTNVEFRQITLKQLVAFMDSVTGSQSSLDVSDLRLTAPRQGDAPLTEIEQWMVEVGLTHLVFTPKS